MGCQQSSQLGSQSSQTQSVHASVWDSEYEEIAEQSYIKSEKHFSKEVLVDLESQWQQYIITPQQYVELSSRSGQDLETDSQDPENQEKSRIYLEKIMVDQWQLERVSEKLNQFKTEKSEYKLLKMNDTIYYGEVRDNKFNGYGILILGDTIYEGMFRNGKFDGSGSLEQKNGYMFKGIFQEGIQNGEGNEISSDGTIRTGNFSQGILSGDDCTIHFQDGSAYKGAVRQNLRHGYGEIAYSDGKQYQGQWKDDMIEGYGTYIYGPGKKYQGQFENGLRDGFGHFWWPDGTQYIGQFSQGRQSGIGTLIDRRGISQDYWWEDGRRLQRCNQSTKQSIISQ